MHIKQNKSKGHTYIQMVKSYRDDNGMPRHELIYNFGRLDRLREDKSFISSINKLTQLLCGLEEDGGDVTEYCSDYVSENWGYKVYEKLWKRFDLPGILKKVQGKTSSKFNLNDACFLMSIEHLLRPDSKLGVYESQDRYFNLPSVELHNIYRSLDILSSYKEELEDELFFKNLSVFNMRVDVVFYDVTTFYFESVRSDGLKDFGYSKDCKFNEVQVVLGLLVDGEGRPIGYELFPGNTFDGNTLDLMLDKLKDRFHIGRVIIVADRGINSKLNLKRIKDKGFDYIFASRIKNLPIDVRDSIFSEEGYHCVERKDAEPLKCKVIDYDNRVRVDKGEEILTEKLIITYSDKRAKKDRSDRERLIEKALTLLNKDSAIDASFKRGGRKYLRKDSSDKQVYSLDEASILRDEKFDGYYGIQTSDKSLSASDVIDAYHNLWKIEESFRIMKSTLEVRPIFHWTENRIKGHFVICFLAFLLERTLEFSIKSSGISASPEKIREALNEMNFSRFRLEGQEYLLQGRYGSLGKKILRSFKISPPSNLSKPENIHF